MWRGGVVFILGCALSACMTTGEVGLTPASVTASSAAAAPPTGEWKFDRRVDRATGKPVGKAFVVTTRVTLRTGRVFARPAGLQLQCFKDKPIVELKFLDRVGSNRSATLAYRFDDKPPRDAAVRFLPDTKTVVIEDKPAVQQFVADLRTANKLFVSINSLVVGATRAEFSVHDAEPAIETGFADCPLPSAPQRRAGAS
jgi:hypothetical protein